MTGRLGQSGSGFHIATKDDISTRQIAVSFKQIQRLRLKVADDHELVVSFAFNDSFE